MKVKVKAPANVIVGAGEPVTLKAGLCQLDPAVAELLVSLGLAEGVKEEDDATQP